MLCASIVLENVCLKDPIPVVMTLSLQGRSIWSSPCCWGKGVRKWPLSCEFLVTWGETFNLWLGGALAIFFLLLPSCTWQPATRRAVWRFLTWLQGCIFHGFRTNYPHMKSCTNAGSGNVLGLGHVMPRLSQRLQRCVKPSAIINHNSMPWGYFRILTCYSTGAGSISDLLLHCFSFVDGRYFTRRVSLY